MIVLVVMNTANALPNQERKVTTLNLSNKIVPIEVSKFAMLRNARVAVDVHKVVKDGAKEPTLLASIVVNDKFRHVFNAKSRITRALTHMTPKDLQDRLNGGSFFFVNDTLVDFRDVQYNGFVHNEESIQKMIDLIGVRAVQHRDRRALGLNTVAADFALSGYYNRAPIIVPEYLTGGVFESALMYNWNPFYQNIRGVFELVRQICSNGMVGVSDFLNTTVPVINKWEEHLEIASRQIQNKVGDKVTARLSQMGTERATIGELQLLANHAVSRITDSSNPEGVPADQRDRLNNIYKIVNPVFHLASRYQAGAFTDANVAAQLPAHLSTFDAFNIATEMYTHSQESDTSSGFALQKFANGLLFDQKNKRAQRLSRAFVEPLLSSFSDADTAFFGTVKA